MDPTPSPLSRVGQALWAALNYITVTVGRYLRPEPANPGNDGTQTGQEAIMSVTTDEQSRTKRKNDKDEKESKEREEKVLRETDREGEADAWDSGCGHKTTGEWCSVSVATETDTKADQYVVKCFKVAETEKAAEEGEEMCLRSVGKEGTDRRQNEVYSPYFTDGEKEGEIERCDIISKQVVETEEHISRHSSFEEGGRGEQGNTEVDCHRDKSGREHNPERREEKVQDKETVKLFSDEDEDGDGEEQSQTKETNREREGEHGYLTRTDEVRVIRGAEKETGDVRWLEEEVVKKMDENEKMDRETKEVRAKEGTEEEILSKGKGENGGEEFEGIFVNEGIEDGEGYSVVRGRQRSVKETYGVKEELKEERRGVRDMDIGVLKRKEEIELRGDDMVDEDKKTVESRKGLSDSGKLRKLEKKDVRAERGFLQWEGGEEIQSDDVEEDTQQIIFERHYGDVSEKEEGRNNDDNDGDGEDDNVEDEDELPPAAEIGEIDIPRVERRGEEMIRQERNNRRERDKRSKVKAEGETYKVMSGKNQEERMCVRDLVRGNKEGEEKGSDEEIGVTDRVKDESYGETLGSSEDIGEHGGNSVGVLLMSQEQEPEKECSKETKEFGLRWEVMHGRSEDKVITAGMVIEKMDEEGRQVDTEGEEERGGRTENTDTHTGEKMEIKDREWQREKNKMDRERVTEEETGSQKEEQMEKTLVSDTERENKISAEGQETEGHKRNNIEVQEEVGEQTAETVGDGGSDTDKRDGENGEGKNKDIHLGIYGVMVVGEVPLQRTQLDEREDEEIDHKTLQTEHFKEETVEEEKKRKGIKEKIKQEINRGQKRKEAENREVGTSNMDEDKGITDIEKNEFNITVRYEEKETKECSEKDEMQSVDIERKIETEEREFEKTEDTVKEKGDMGKDLGPTLEMEAEAVDEKTDEGEEESEEEDRILIEGTRGENTEGVEESEYIEEMEDKAWVTEEKGEGMEVRPEEVRTFTIDEEMHDDLGIEVAGETEKREMEGDEEGMKESKMDSEDGEPTEMQSEKCEDRETEKRIIAELENKGTEGLNVEKENEEIKESAVKGVEDNTDGKEFGELKQIGGNDKDGPNEERDADVKRDNVSKQTEADKDVHEKDIGTLNTDKDEGIADFERNRENMCEMPVEGKEKESEECSREMKTIETEERQIKETTIDCDVDGGKIERENITTEKAQVEAVWQEVDVGGEMEEKDIKAQVREVYQKEAPGAPAVGEEDDIIREEWKEDIKRDKKGVKSNSVQMKVILDGDGQDREGVDGRVSVEEHGQEEQFAEVETEEEGLDGNYAGQENTEDAVMVKGDMGKDVGPTLEMEAEAVDEEEDEGREKSEEEDRIPIEGKGGENTEGVEESEYIGKIEDKAWVTEEKGEGMEVRPEEVRTFTIDEEIHDDVEIEVAGETEKGEMEGDEEGMKESKMDSEDGEPTEMQPEKCEDRETEKRIIAGLENKETEGLNVEKENEEIKESAVKGVEDNTDGKECGELKQIGENDKDGPNEERDADVKRDNVSKQTETDKDVHEKDIGKLNTDKDEGIADFERNRENMSEMPVEGKEKESEECSREMKTIETEERQIKETTIECDVDEEKIERENITTEKAQVEAVWQEVDVGGEREEKDIETQVREVYQKGGPGGPAVGEEDDIIREEWKEDIKRDKKGVKSNSVQMKVILDGDGQDREGVDGRVSVEEHGQEEQFAEVETEEEGLDGNYAGQENTEDAVMVKGDMGKDVGPTLEMEAEAVDEVEDEGREKSEEEDRIPIQGKGGENTKEVGESEYIGEIEDKAWVTEEKGEGMEVRPEEVRTFTIDEEMHEDVGIEVAGETEKREMEGDEEGMKESKMDSEDMQSEKCEDIETEKRIIAELENKEMKESADKGVEDNTDGKEFGELKQIGRNGKDGLNEGTDIDDVTKEEVGQQENDQRMRVSEITELHLQLDAPSLDFTAQKSRIALKNPQSRPPRDPRTLLHIPSLITTPSTSPLFGQLNIAPVAVKQRGPGVIGFRLPGMGGGLPALKRTQRGSKEREGVTSQDSGKESTSDAPGAGMELMSDIEEGVRGKVVGIGATGVKMPGFDAGFPALKKTERGVKMRQRTPEEDTTSCSDRIERSGRTGADGTKGSGVPAIKLPVFDIGFPVLRKTDRGVRMRGEDTEYCIQHNSAVEQTITDVGHQEALSKAKWTPPKEAGIGISDHSMISELKNKLKNTEKE